MTTGVPIVEGAKESKERAAIQQEVMYYLSDTYLPGRYPDMPRGTLDGAVNKYLKDNYGMKNQLEDMRLDKDSLVAQDPLQSAMGPVGLDLNQTMDAAYQGAVKAANTRLTTDGKAAFTAAFLKTLDDKQAMGSTEQADLNVARQDVAKWTETLFTPDPETGASPYSEWNQRENGSVFAGKGRLGSMADFIAQAAPAMARSANLGQVEGSSRGHTIEQILLQGGAAVNKAIRELDDIVNTNILDPLDKARDPNGGMSPADRTALDRAILQITNQMPSLAQGLYEARKTNPMLSAMDYVTLDKRVGSAMSSNLAGTEAGASVNAADPFGSATSVSMFATNRANETAWETATDGLSDAQKLAINPDAILKGAGVMANGQPNFALAQRNLAKGITANNKVVAAQNKQANDLENLQGTLDLAKARNPALDLSGIDSKKLLQASNGDVVAAGRELAAQVDTMVKSEATAKRNDATLDKNSAVIAPGGAVTTPGFDKTKFTPALAAKFGVGQPFTLQDALDLAHSHTSWGGLYSTAPSQDARYKTMSDQGDAAVIDLWNKNQADYQKDPQKFMSDIHGLTLPGAATPAQGQGDSAGEAPRVSGGPAGAMGTAGQPLPPSIGSSSEAQVAYSKARSAWDAANPPEQVKQAPVKAATAV